MAKPIEQAHWRDSARPVRLFIWDAKALFPLVFFLLYMRLWTFIVAMITIMFFTILNRYGFSLMVFARVIRNWVSGARKISRPWWQR